MNECVWMSMYMCVCVYTCKFSYSLICLWSVAESLTEVTSWVHFNYSVLFSQQIVIYLYLFQCLAKLSELFDDCFPGKVFPFFFPFGGKGRGSHLVRIIAKNQQIKQSYLEMCNILVYWLAPQINSVYSVHGFQFSASDMFHMTLKLRFDKKSQTWEHLVHGC